MQYVSSLGGPRVLLPTEDISRWIQAMGPSPSPDDGLYGLACSVTDYCGVIDPWGKKILIFGDDPSDMYWLPSPDGGLFFRWIGADSLQQLTDFAKDIARLGNWTESVLWEADSEKYTAMDTCSFHGDDAPTIQLNLVPGRYRVDSLYAEDDDVMSIIQKLQRIS